MTTEAHVRIPGHWIPDPLGDELGATAAKYAVLIGLIAAVITGTVAALGLEAEALFNDPALHDALTR